MDKNGLCVIETHPVQYHAPVYRELGRLGVNVTAIYGSNFSIRGYRDPEFQEQFAWDSDLVSGYQQIFLDTTRATRYEEVDDRGLADALTQLNPAAVLTVGYGTRFDRTGARAAFKRKLPVLFRGETTDHARKRRRVKAAARDIWLKRFYRRCARLLYVGQRSLAHFRRLGCTDNRLEFSPYCVDLSAFAPREEDRALLREPTRARLHTAPGDYVVLFSGKLVERKDPLILIEAALRVHADLRSRIVLWFLGDGPLRAELAHAAAHAGLRARFIGFENQHSLSAYYHGADVLVLPSRRDETWGLVVNEALAHGTPAIVSSSVGCAPDLIVPGVTGLSFPPGDSHQLADALVQSARRIDDVNLRVDCRARVGAYSVRAAAEGISRAFAAVTARD